MCWVKFSKKLSFSESLHSACSVFVSFFLFLRLVFELFKRLGAPCMFFFLLLFSVLFFIIIQQHFSVRANAFWTASFLPFQAGCHCCCLWAGCIYLGVIGVWMSEVMRCIHTWLLPSLRAGDRRSLAGLRLELHHTAVSSTQARMALSYPGGQTQSLGLIPQWGVCSLKWCVCANVCMSTYPRVCVCSYACICGRRGGKKQRLVVGLSLSWVLVCLAACVCISDFPCVFVSACISGWVGVQWSSRRTSGSHSPLPTSNCPWCPAELPNDFTYTSLICLARVAATVWRFSLYMPFAASYPVKFNCTAPTVASVGGSPSSSLSSHTLPLSLSVCHLSSL